MICLLVHLVIAPATRDVPDPLQCAEVADSGPAESSLPTITWAAPPECPLGEDVHARILTMCSPPLTDFTLIASVSRTSGGYRLAGQIGFEGRSQPLTVSTAGDCEALVNKLILNLKTLCPYSRSRGSRGAPITYSSYVRVAALAEVGAMWACTGDTCPAELDDLRPRWTGRSSCSGGICADHLPMFGALLGGGRRVGRRLRLELAFPLYAAASSVEASPGLGAATMTWLRTGAQGRLCGAREGRRIEWLLCCELGLQLMLGRSQAEVSDRFNPGMAVIAWGSVRAALGMIWWIHPRLGLRLEVAPGVHIHPPNYGVYDINRDKDLRRSLSKVGFPHVAFGLGFDVRFGPRGKGAG